MRVGVLVCLLPALAVPGLPVRLSALPAQYEPVLACSKSKTCPWSRATPRSTPSPPLPPIRLRMLPQCMQHVSARRPNIRPSRAHAHMAQHCAWRMQTGETGSGRGTAIAGAGEAGMVPRGESAETGENLSFVPSVRAVYPMQAPLPKPLPAFTSLCACVARCSVTDEAVTVRLVIEKRSVRTFAIFCRVYGHHATPSPNYEPNEG